MIRVDIKPLSVNKCWQGKRFKTPEYKMYEKSCLMMLPKIKLPEPPYMITYVFGLSNLLSDFDNPVKPITDILQKKYGFNDRDIYEASIKKVKVEKGKEFFSFKIEKIL